MSQYLTSFLGFCALVQVCFLPGYLVCRVLNVRGRLEVLLFSFALSLLINHALVVGLVAAGWYRANVLYAIFAGELVLASLMSMRGRAAARDEGGAADGAAPCAESSLYLFGRHAALVTIAVYVWLAWQNVGTVFTTWDAVGSWNPWGVAWAKGIVPRIWGTYPQLIPTSYSLTYVFMENTQLQFFAKGMLGLFPLGALAAIYALGAHIRCAGCMFGVAIAGLLQYYVNVAKLENMMFSGYADVPVSFFVTMAFYCVMRAADDTEIAGSLARGARRFIWLGALMCVAAAVTKQTGLYMAAVYPVLVWGLVLRPTGMTLSKSARQLTPAVAVIALLAAPWYAYRWHMIRSGQALDNFEELVVHLHRDQTFRGRLRIGMRKLRDAMPFASALKGLAALHLASLTWRPTRWLYVLVIAPFTVIWAVGFSYSLRNLALAVPLMGLAAGLGLEQIIRAPAWLRARMEEAESKRTGVHVDSRNGGANSGFAWGWAGAKLLILVIVVGSLALPRDWLFERQAELQKQVGDPLLNRFLYDYHEMRPVRGLISTHYSALNYIPGFEHRAIGLPMGSFETYEKHRQMSGVEYFLVPSWLDSSYDARIAEDIRRRIGSREYKCIYDEHAWLYVRKMTPTGWMLDDALARAEALVEAEQFDEAAAQLADQPLAEFEAPGRACYLLAYSLHQSFARGPAGRPAPTAALDLYTRAIELGFSEFWSRYQRGCLLAMLGRPEEAAADLERAVKLKPDHAAARGALKEVGKAADSSATAGGGHGKGA